jgi:XTP/dITP diphosphohydrolase
MARPPHPGCAVVVVPPAGTSSQAGPPESPLDVPGLPPATRGLPPLDDVGALPFDAPELPSLDASGLPSLDAVGLSSLDASGLSSLDAVGALPLDAVGLLPLAAVGALLRAAAIYADASVPHDVASVCGAAPLPSPEELAARAASEPVVVLTTGGDGGLPGVRVIGSARPLGAGLVAAAAVMDRLRSPGGCPWDAEQTHESLRRFLLEETYELLDAIDAGDREAFREELGDVLLQVLFHARIAAEDPVAPFDIDDVASELAAKLIRRHPHVFSVDDAVHDASSQELRWEQLKAEEKQRTSIVDGVALDQPALSLVAALARRAARAGAHPPEEAGDGVGERLFAIAVQAAVSGEDPELALRAVAKRFATHLQATVPPTP